MIRDLGIVLIGYLVVIHVASHQALSMALVAIAMNGVFLLILYSLYISKGRK